MQPNPGVAGAGDGHFEVHTILWYSYQKETIKKRHVAMSYKKLFILRYVYYLISLFFDRILIEQYLSSFDTLS